jgi:hypothetical protein
MVSKALQALTPVPPGLQLGGRLTGSILHVLSQAFFVAPRDFANGFVAGRQRHDGDQRPDQRESAGHAPAGEDDAEVCRVPGE